MDENKYYLRIAENTFGFVLEVIHDILETYIKITNDDYNSFFENQSKGKQYRLKSKQSKTNMPPSKRFRPL